jgi:PleD family two-component response regulator
LKRRTGRDSIIGSPAEGVKLVYLILSRESYSRRATDPRALESEGYDVLEALDGKTAMRLVGNISSNLIVQDLLSPDIDGVELVKRLRGVLDVLSSSQSLC